MKSQTTKVKEKGTQTTLKKGHSAGSLVSEVLVVMKMENRDRSSERGPKKGRGPACEANPKFQKKRA